MKTPDQRLTLIAFEYLNIPTLVTRKNDALDFHCVSVWGVQNALQAAYELGTGTGFPFDAGLPTRFDGYEIHGVREFDEGNGKFCEQVPDEEAEFWSLYGHIPGEGVECIGDYKTREHAEETYARITGRRFTAVGR